MAAPRLLEGGGEVCFDEGLVVVSPSAVPPRSPRPPRASSLLVALLVVTGAAVAGVGGLSGCAQEPAPIEDPLILPPSKPRQEPMILAPRVSLDVCDPREVPDFKPTYTPSQPFYQKRCDAEQVSMLTYCISRGRMTSSLCQSFYHSADNLRCVECAISRPTFQSLGAMIEYDTNVYAINFAGCVANTSGEYGPSSCAARVQAARNCLRASCAKCEATGATGTDERKLRIFECEEEALRTTCKPYADAQICGLDLQNGPSRVCTKDTGSVEIAAYINLFCGVNPADGASGSGSSQ